MDAFLFSFNSVFPIFLVMALGYFLKHIGVINDAFINVGTKITFTVAIPCMVFPSILNAHLEDTFDLKLIIYAVLATIVALLILRLVVPRFIHEAASWSAFIQGAFRSNFIIIGFALASSLGGEAALAKTAMMLVFIGPLYNILSVLVLAEAEKGKEGHSIAKSLYTNPVLISTTLAIILSLLNVQLPEFISSPIDMLGDMTLPLSLLTLGGSISFNKEEVNLRQALVASTIKVVIIPLIFIPLAYLLGFRGIDIIICLILFGSPAAVSCFPMAYQMGADHRLSGMISAMTNTMAILTLFLFVFALRILSII